MADWLHTLTQWHWLILGVVLLILEMLGASGFLIGLAVASLVMAGAVALGVIDSWSYQLLWFALLGVAFTVLYWRMFRSFNRHTDEPLLNDRAAQLIGRKFVLTQNLDNGQGRVQVGDTLWKAEADTSLTAGIEVEVYASEGMVIKVRPLTKT
ncbi:NfeD family protein [Amphritea sp. 1_MG-2023]|uniref:NfeD family protein n=1 Tax=Amphritea sp. 1_MG-2023 TaxID=3062670 RepID=UPI0026E28DEA|nr:NfeD family protein [Amphritea sp. 1_MG-2023]MDO6562694.1 NfeD family protein [Amphritea sp. 1_MG-2023]